MNIFLDSNTLFSDPFFKSNFARNLLETVKGIDGKIYISSVVRQEVLNNYKREVRKRRKEFGEAFNKINKILITNIEHTLKDDDYYLAELIDYYQKMIDEGYLVIIPHTEFDMLDEIVQRALNNKKPFDHQKEEFKDTVIWLSYAKFVENQEINGFLISNNTKDFYAPDKESIHSDLLDDTKRLTPYKSIEDFMTLNSDYIQELLAKKEEERSIIELLDWADDNITESYVETVIAERFYDKLYPELELYVENLFELDLHKYIKTQYDISKIEPEIIKGLSLIAYEREFFGSEIIIYGTLSVDHYVALYIWNSFRDKGEDPFLFVGNDTITYSVDFTYTINKEFKVDNFELNDISLPVLKKKTSKDIKVNPEEIF